MSDDAKQTLGEEIIEGLTELREAVKAGTPLRKKFTVRTVELDLRPKEYGAEDVKATRSALGVSQAIFAEILATSVDSVQHWEQGLREVPSMACRLLDLISNDRDNWTKILEQAVKDKETASA